VDLERRRQFESEEVIFANDNLDRLPQYWVVHDQVSANGLRTNRRRSLQGLMIPEERMYLVRMKSLRGSPDLRNAKIASQMSAGKRDGMKGVTEVTEDMGARL
jgi:hypothetical protein